MPRGSHPSTIENIHREPFGSLFVAFVSLELLLKEFTDFCFLNYLAIISVTLFLACVLLFSSQRPFCSLSLLSRLARFASIAFFTYTVNPKN